MACTAAIPKIHTLQEIESIISTDSQLFAKQLIDAIQEGFVAYSKGNFNSAPIQTLGAPPLAPFVDVENYSAQTCVKSGYITGGQHYVIKVASGGYPHPNGGLMQLYSQQTGKFEMLLLDDGLLTELRTAAVGAVAARMLAPDLSDEAACIGILGTGFQARYQLEYLAHVTQCRNVRVWGRTENKRNQFIEEMRAQGWNICAVESPQHLLQPPEDDWFCPLIVTTTSSREPLLNLVEENDHTKRPLHITCIGSDSTGKLELHPELVAAADLLVADSRLQTQERGEFEDAIKQGLVPVDKIIELGELALDKNSWRSSDNDNRLTIFDSSGVAVQDCIIASMVAQRMSKK